MPIDGLMRRRAQVGAGGVFQGIFGMILGLILGMIGQAKSFRNWNGGWVFRAFDA
jgi:hypothetical protein